MKAYVDAGICMGCGLCIGICPEVFELGDSGKAHAVGAITPDNENAVRAAIDSCPVSGILEEN